MSLTNAEKQRNYRARQRTRHLAELRQASASPATEPVVDGDGDRTDERYEDEKSLMPTIGCEGFSDGPSDLWPPELLSGPLAGIFVPESSAGVPEGARWPLGDSLQRSAEHIRQLAPAET